MTVLFDRGVIADDARWWDAQLIQRAWPGWVVWWGDFSRRFYAVPRHGLQRLYEAETTAELLKQMTRHGPVPPPLEIDVVLAHLAE